MVSVMLGTAFGIVREGRKPEARVVEAQTSGGECCKRYDLTLHVPAEERDPTSFVKRIQWKASPSTGTVAPIRFSVEYCAGINLEGPCSSYLGEITIDGQIQELGASNGGAASWPLPYCDQGENSQCRLLTSGSIYHPCKLVELFLPSGGHRTSDASCGYEDDPASEEPCFNDFDHHLTIAEKIFQGQTKRFTRIWIIQDPAADPTSGSPPRLIQRDDPYSEDPLTGALEWDCGPSVDEFFMVVRPWLSVPASQFVLTSPGGLYSDPDVSCRFIASACFPYWFYRYNP